MLTSRCVCILILYHHATRLHISFMVKHYPGGVLHHTDVESNYKDLMHGNTWYIYTNLYQATLLPKCVILSYATSVAVNIFKVAWQAFISLHTCQYYITSCGSPVDYVTVCFISFYSCVTCVPDFCFNAASSLSPSFDSILHWLQNKLLQFKLIILNWAWLDDLVT